MKVCNAYANFDAIRNAYRGWTQEDFVKFMDLNLDRMCNFVNALVKYQKQPNDKNWEKLKDAYDAGNEVKRFRGEGDTFD